MISFSFFSLRSLSVYISWFLYVVDVPCARGRDLFLDTLTRPYFRYKFSSVFFSFEQFFPLPPLLLLVRSFVHRLRTFNTYAMRELCAARRARAGGRLNVWLSFYNSNLVSVFSYSSSSSDSFAVCFRFLYSIWLYWFWFFSLLYT